MELFGEKSPVESIWRIPCCVWNSMGQVHAFIASGVNSFITISTVVTGRHRIGSGATIAVLAELAWRLLQKTLKKWERFNSWSDSKAARSDL
jgi:hypothetical protein